MIAKCIVVLAIVAQINGQVCSSSCLGSGSYGASSCGGGATTRNIVARGKYPVLLQSSGPCVDKRVPVSASHVQTPVQVKPTVRLPACIPSQKTVAHSCTCYKTVMRPRVHEQYITVPSVQHYIETTHRPVVENIHYEACPVNTNDNVDDGLVGSYGMGGSFGGSFGGSCGNGASVVAVAPVQVAAPVAVAPVQVAAPVACETVAPVQVARVQTVTPVQVATVQTVSPVQVSAVPVASYSSVGSLGGCGCGC